MEMAIGVLFWLFVAAIVLDSVFGFGDWRAKRRRVRLRVSKDDFAFAQEAAREAGFTRTEEYFAVLLKKALRAERQ